jgi:hypothetical protein
MRTGGFFLKHQHSLNLSLHGRNSARQNNNCITDARPLDMQQISILMNFFLARFGQYSDACGASLHQRIAYNL